jgi:hypothetical protein
MRIFQTCGVCVLTLFAVTESAQAGIPIATWSIPYLLIGIVLMGVFIWLTSLLKPEHVEVGHVSLQNSSPLAVACRYIAGFFGIAAMGVTAWGVYDAIAAGAF